MSNPVTGPQRVMLPLRVRVFEERRLYDGDFGGEPRSSSLALHDQVNTWLKATGNALVTPVASPTVSIFTVSPDGKQKLVVVAQTIAYTERPHVAPARPRDPKRNVSNSQIRFGGPENSEQVDNREPDATDAS